MGWNDHGNPTHWISQNLTTLHINNEITSLPESIGNLTNLTALHMRKCIDGTSEIH